VCIARSWCKEGGFVTRVSISVILLLAVGLAGCLAAVPAESPPTAGAPTATAAPCNPEPIVVPTPPAEIPGYTELDPTTGLHMTGTPQQIDLQSYRLEVTGKVDEPLSLTYDELRCLPRVETRCVLTCPGFFQDEATWAGASLDAVLERAGVQPDARQLRLVGADGYSAIVFLDQLQPGESFLAYEWEGEPLPILHGFPLRAVFPALDGNKWVKWLVRIDVV
jgi:DMSO/TMAO reductase YedYZ molybdopterin-dependent catalytic subunit